MVSVYIALRPLVSLPKAVNDSALIHVVTLSITVGLKNECLYLADCEGMVLDCKKRFGVRRPFLNM